MSVWQTPQASRRTRTSPVLGPSSSTCWTTSGCPNSSSTAARICMAGTLSALCRGPDQDLVDVHVWGLGDRVHHRTGDVVGLERARGLVVEERRVDHARLDQRDAHPGLVEVLAQRL